RAFFNVELNLAHGLAEVSPVHLIRTAIAELRSGVGSFAEGTIEAGSEFRGIRKDRSVGEFSVIERLADGGDAAVHHVGRSDDVHAGTGQRDQSAGKEIEGRVVYDLVIELCSPHGE